MIHLFFIILNDQNSENTLNILKFLDSHINILNKKQYVIDIKLVDKEAINTTEFQNFIESNNVQSIPALILKNNEYSNTISNVNNISVFLNNIVNNADANPSMQRNQHNTSNNNDVDDDDNDSIYLQNFITSEVCSKHFESPDDILSKGHQDDKLMERMKEFNTRRGSMPNDAVNNNNNRDTQQSNELSYEDKLFNKSNLTGDDKLISDKFLNE